MKVKVPAIVKDPTVAEYKDIQPTEDITIEEDIFLDGPISPRVAVLDFHQGGASLAPGVKFIASDKSNAVGKYDVPFPLLSGELQASREAAATSVFGVVNKTIQMFEEKDALGRRVAWAFGAPQLLVVPDAGELANAYYERDSHSLQFYHFVSQEGLTIHTAHSQDIVAHETAHALIDGIAPDLYGAITPQSLAIHESIADMAALICSFRCRDLTKRILTQTNGSLATSTAFSSLARQFAEALDKKRHYLRNLRNDKTMKDLQDRSEPHELSEVLSGAFYGMLVKLHDELRAQYERGQKEDDLGSQEDQSTESQILGEMRSGTSRSVISAAIKALFVAGERLKRVLLRGLDYLPPGDATFADLARAVLAADMASHADSFSQREWIVSEFLRRGIVKSHNELKVHANFDHADIRKLDLEDLTKSDYVAYGFADRFRDFLGIPDHVPFEVRPRLDVTRRYRHHDGWKESRECIFKVSWTRTERNRAGHGLPSRRRYCEGSTLAIEWQEKPKVRALLSTTRTAADRNDSDTLLRKLAAAGMLRMGDDALNPGGKPLKGAIAADVLGGVLKVQNTGKMLHIIQGDRS